jgi:hypothetical protein
MYVNMVRSRRLKRQKLMWEWSNEGERHLYKDGEGAEVAGGKLIKIEKIVKAVGDDKDQK